MIPDPLRSPCEGADRRLGSVHTAPIPDFHVPCASWPARPGVRCAATSRRRSRRRSSSRTGPCAVGDAFFGQLMGRVGEVVFAFGDTDTIVAPASGDLELAANDLTPSYWDNTGTFASSSADSARSARKAGACRPPIGVPGPARAPARAGSGASCTVRASICQRVPTLFRSSDQAGPGTARIGRQRRPSPGHRETRACWRLPGA